MPRIILNNSNSLKLCLLLHPVYQHHHLHRLLLEWEMVFLLILSLHLHLLVRRMVDHIVRCRLPQGCRIEKAVLWEGVYLNFYE